MQTELKYTPENLARWTRPPSYMGATWEEYFGAGVGQNRDSCALARANFDAMKAILKAIPCPEDWPHEDAPWQVVSENHWAVGWVEWIAIHEDATAHLQAADRACARLENYPVLDDNLFSQYETDEANSVWANCYNPRERVAWIRRHKSQFEFHSFADMLGCVRGKHFAGYASELLN